MEWHVRAGEQQWGPVSEEDVLEWARTGRLRPWDHVWCDGMDQWLPPYQVQPFAAVLPPPLAPPSPAAGMGDDAGMRALLPVGRSGFAIAAGYLGLVSVLLLPAPLAIIFAILAIRAIHRDPHKHGMGRAIFGLIMGILGTAALGAITITSVLDAAS